MAQGLLINTADLVRYTALSGNVDQDEYIQYIKIAQDVHGQNYLGTTLLAKLENDVLNGSLTGKYLELVNKYIKPMLIHFTMVEYLPFSAVTIANKGVYKHGSEDSQNVDKNEVDSLTAKERQTAEFYAQRFVKYMCENNHLFPEYTEVQGSGMNPDKNINVTNWFL